MPLQHPYMICVKRINYWYSCLSIKVLLSSWLTTLSTQNYNLIRDILVHLDVLLHSPSKTVESIQLNLLYNFANHGYTSVYESALQQCPNRECWALKPISNKTSIIIELKRCFQSSLLQLTTPLKSIQGKGGFSEVLKTANTRPMYNKLPLTIPVYVLAHIPCMCKHRVHSGQI